MSQVTSSTSGRLTNRLSISQSPRGAAAPSPSNVALIPNKAYSNLPSHILPTCPFDKILIDYMEECRKRAAMGQSWDDVLGPPWPDMTTLLYPELEGTTRPHSPSTLLASTMRGFTSIQGLAQKMATCSCAYYIYRWLIAPTSENFDLVPDQLRPTDDQIQIPHPIWIEYDTLLVVFNLDMY